MYFYSMVRGRNFIYVGRRIVKRHEGGGWLNDATRMGIGIWVSMYGTSMLYIQVVH